MLFKMLFLISSSSVGYDHVNNIRLLQSLSKNAKIFWYNTKCFTQTYQLRETKTNNHLEPFLEFYYH